MTPAVQDGDGKIENKNDSPPNDDCGCRGLCVWVAGWPETGGWCDEVGIVVSQSAFRSASGAPAKTGPLTGRYFHMTAIREVTVVLSPVIAGIQKV